MAAALADRSGTVAERINITVPVMLDSALTLTVAAGGNAKTGRLILFIIQEP